MKILTTIVLLLTVFFCSVCRADTITLKTGYKSDGSIIGVNADSLVFKSGAVKSYFVTVYNKSDIESIKLEPSKSFEEFSVFDRMIFKNGSVLYGLVEAETARAVYFSIKLDGGIAILEYNKETIAELDGTYGIKKILGKAYFKWKYFLYDLKLLLGKIRSKDSSTLNSFLYDIKSGVFDVPDMSKALTPEKFRELIKSGGISTAGIQYVDAVKNRKVLIGMPEKTVRGILGEPNSKKQRGDLYEWSYLSGETVKLHIGRVIGYSAKNREKIESEVRLYFSDKISP